MQNILHQLEFSKMKFWKREWQRNFAQKLRKINKNKNGNQEK